MMKKTRLAGWCLAAATLIQPVHAFADTVGNTANTTIIRHTGVSGLWILANISYAGMRAQNHPSWGWRIVSFIFGFPGTLLSFLVVREGSGRAYGINLGKE